MNRKMLTQPWPPEAIRSRPGYNGETVPYIDIATILARLDAAVDHWDFRVLRYEVLDSEVVVLGELVADGVTKCAFGGANIALDRSGQIISTADSLKAGAADALRKCASLLGVPLPRNGRDSDDAADNGVVNATVAGSAGTNPASRATVRQISTIHGLARRRGLARDRLAAYVAEHTGKSELSQLSRTEASSLIDGLSSGNGASA